MTRQSPLNGLVVEARQMLQDEGVEGYTSPAPESPIEQSASQRFWYSLREVFLFSAYRLVDL